MDCPNCGATAAGPDQRFCAKCGTNLAPAAPPTAYGQAPRITGPLFADDPPPPPPPPPPALPTYAVPSAPQPAYVAPPVAPQQPAAYDDGRGRRRRSIVLLAVAAVFAALIGAGGVVLLFASDDPNDDASAEDRQGDAATRAGDGTSAPTSPAETDVTGTTGTTETTDPAGFRCWDGSAGTRLAQCTPPTGEAGLAWVFPAFDGATCSVGVADQRATEADCSPAVGGEAVRFHYSEWMTRPDLDVYYGRNTIAEIAPPDGRGDLTAVHVESRDPDVGYKVAIYYADPTALWSVTIYAADEAQYGAALDQLEMRPFRQLRGERD